VYSILKDAQIDSDFEMLLRITAPLPVGQDHILQHMRPFERLGNASHQTASMMEYDKDAPIEHPSHQTALMMEDAPIEYPSHQTALMMECDIDAPIEHSSHQTASMMEYD